MTYTCPNCGNKHDEWPALAFSSPKYYAELSTSDKEKIATLDLDFWPVFNLFQQFTYWLNGSNGGSQADSIIRVVVYCRPSQSIKIGKQ
jgi:Uncharacterized protein conserved in bacteria (DUF2199)